MFDLHRTPFPISVIYGAASLFLCIFTTTFTHSIHVLRYARLALALPTCAFFYAVAYPPTNIGVEANLMSYTVGAYGMMKTLDICVTGFWDEPQDVPRWQLVGNSDSKGRPFILPLPQTLMKRIAYSLDYLFAVRGGSFYKGRVFSWALEPMRTSKGPTTYEDFVKSRIKSIAIDSLAFDVLSNVIASNTWDVTRPQPLTSTLPMGWQVFYTIVLGLQIYFSLFLVVDVVCIVLVPLLRLEPETWVPFWWDPYKSVTLQEFWLKRWHATFQRVFYRIPVPIVETLRPYLSKSQLRFARAATVFGVSAIYHMGVAVTRLPWDTKRYIVFWESSVIWCFMSQPFGLLIESTLIVPSTETLDDRLRTSLRRAFFWAWLIWTGRWFCDSYLAYGPFDDLVLGPFSPTSIIIQHDPRVRLLSSLIHHLMARPVKSTAPPPPLQSLREEEKRGAHSKTKDLSHVPCKFFKAGQCTAGSSCPFSHAAPEPGQPKQACQWFVGGNCRFGHKCALAHIMPGEPMSMDRKNKKAAQLAAQAEKEKATTNGHSDSGAPSTTGTSGSGRQRDRKDRDKDRTSRKTMGGSGAKASSSTRDRSLRSERREVDLGAPNRSEDGSSLTASVATLRPPIRIGKGPTTSASVTAPPVLGDTSAPSFSQNPDLEPDRPSWATASLEHVQIHSRQATITPATEHLALSDYSQTPNAKAAELPSASSPAPQATSPKRPLQGSPLASSLLSSSRNSSEQHVQASFRSGIANELNRASSPAIQTSNTSRSNYGPIGSPPRAAAGALSSIMAGLTLGGAPPRSDVPQASDGPSSVTSQSSIHAHMNTATLGTSPFSAPGSRALFMGYPAAPGEPSSVTSQSNIPAYLGGGHGPLKAGVPASFAGSRAIGWGAGTDGRRPSLPGHHQRPSIGGSSIRSGVLDEIALEEEDGDGLEAEEFLPSSLSNLLTKEERARRFSRGGARPAKEVVIGDDADDDFDTLRRSIAVQDAQHSAFSRSVPATTFLNNPRAMRSLWENDVNQPSGNGTEPFTGMTRTLSSNAAGGDTFVGSLGGSYGPSPSMLSSSVLSNSSAAFLGKARVAPRTTSYGAPTTNGPINDLQIGSYNPQGTFYGANTQGHGAGHHHHSSISGITSAGLQAQSKGLASQNSGQYSMYAGPSDLALDPKHNGHGLHQPGPHTAGVGMDDLLHEPGQSLPRGLGAGLSRLHFVPAMSLGSGVGSPTPGTTFGSPGPTSPPSFGTAFPLDKQNGPAPNRTPYGSGLTARLAAAGIGPRPPGFNLPDQSFGQNIQSNPPWAHGNLATPLGGPRANLDDVEVDEGTLFNMD